MDKTEVFNIYGTYVEIQLYVNEAINKRFSKIANIDEEEFEGKSAFDEIDEEYKEENKINIDIYKAYRDILNYNIQFSIQYLKNSYYESMNCNLSEMLDYIYFYKKNIVKTEDSNEDIY